MSRKSKKRISKELDGLPFLYEYQVLLLDLPFLTRQQTLSIF